MKKILIVLIAVAISVTSVVHADEWALEVIPHLSLPSNSDIESGWGIKGKLKFTPQDDPQCPSLYLYGSYSTLYQRRFGQRAGDVQIYGGGLGLEAPITRWLSVYGDIGYFHPISDMEKNTEEHEEVPYWYWRRFATSAGVPVPPFGSYRYKLRGNVGGDVGLNLHYTYKRFATGLDIGYSFRRFEEHWYGDFYDQRWGRCYWETKSREDFGGPLFGISIQFQF